jgi:hypothetical protein
LGVSKTRNKAWEKYDRLHARKDIEKCWQCDTCATRRDLEPGIWPNSSVQHWGLFERIATDVAGHFQWSNQGNGYILIARDYFSKWLEAYAIPNQEDLTVAEALVTNFYNFEVPWGVHNQHDLNFKSRLMQEGFQHLGVSKIRTTPLYHKLDGMIKNGRIAPEGLRCKTAHLPTCLRGMHSGPYSLTLARLVFRREV